MRNLTGPYNVFQREDGPFVAVRDSKGHTLTAEEVAFMLNKYHRMTSDATKEIPYEEIVADLNDVLDLQGNRRFRVGATVRRLIAARFADNPDLDLDAFKHVHRVKWQEWGETEYHKFLRPETLYGPKFQSYLSQPSRTGNYSPVTVKNLKEAERFGNGEDEQPK